MVQVAAPILNIVVPQSPHFPRVAGRPFFMVTRCAFWMSRRSRHFMQYPVIERSSPAPTGCPSLRARRNRTTSKNRSNSCTGLLHGRQALTSSRTHQFREPTRLPSTCTRVVVSCFMPLQVFRYTTVYPSGAAVKGESGTSPL